MTYANSNQQAHLNRIQKALNHGNFIQADHLLKEYKGSLDDLIVKSMAAAVFLSLHIKNYFHNFSIIKSPLLKSMSGYLNSTEVKELVYYSSDIVGGMVKIKIDAFNCYIDNLSDRSLHQGNKCLKTVLDSWHIVQNHNDTISILKSHIKCEPGLDCPNIKAKIFEQYTKNPIVTAVMDGGAHACAERNCNIIYTFDDHYLSKDDDQPFRVQFGYYNRKTDLFISGKSSHPSSVFVHELTHMLMQSLYQFYANPYPDSNLPQEANKFHSKQNVFDNLMVATDTLLDTLPSQNPEQDYIKHTISYVKHFYSTHKVSGEVVARYAEMATLVKEENLDYYMELIGDYFNASIIPDIQVYIES